FDRTACHRDAAAPRQRARKSMFRLHEPPGHAAGGIADSGECRRRTRAEVRRSLSFRSHVFPGTPHHSSGLAGFCRSPYGERGRRRPPNGHCDAEELPLQRKVGPEEFFIDTQIPRFARDDSFSFCSTPVPRCARDDTFPFWSTRSLAALGMTGRTRTGEAPSLTLNLLVGCHARRLRFRNVGELLRLGRSGKRGDGGSASRDYLGYFVEVPGADEALVLHALISVLALAGEFLLLQA